MEIQKDYLLKVGDKFMTIPCRTGCGKQISYEPNYFQDGFVYLLPKNSDDSIHKCSNLPENDMDWINGNFPYCNKVRNKKLENLSTEELNKIEDEYLSQFSALYAPSTLAEASELYAQINETTLDDFEQKKLNQVFLNKIKIRCTLFPAPFSIDESYGNLNYESQLCQLSTAYQALEMYEESIHALEIQNKITNDQNERIEELQKIISSKQSNVEKVSTNSQQLEKITLNLSDDSVLKELKHLEGVIKKIIREKIPFNFLKENFPQELSEAAIKMKNQYYYSPKNDDPIYYLTFGECVMIFRKCNYEFLHLENQTIKIIDSCRHIRNTLSHVTSETKMDSTSSFLDEEILLMSHAHYLILMKKLEKFLMT